MSVFFCVQRKFQVPGQKIFCKLAIEVSDSALLPGIQVREEVKEVFTYHSKSRLAVTFYPIIVHMLIAD